tara:strand:+ start:1062 stop:1379 length:318 start_codon:yes stop_codon:yes gene_type:complete
MGQYAQDIKKVYRSIGDKARQQAQEQSDHKQTLDMVNSPPHYNNSGIECIEAIKAMLGGGFKYYLQGNILKYLWRYEYKDGVQDLKKAQWYLSELIDNVEENDTT